MKIPVYLPISITRRHSPPRILKHSICTSSISILLGYRHSTALPRRKRVLLWNQPASIMNRNPLYLISRGFIFNLLGSIDCLSKSSPTRLSWCKRSLAQGLPALRNLNALVRDRCYIPAVPVPPNIPYILAAVCFLVICRQTSNLHNELIGDLARMFWEGRTNMHSVRKTNWIFDLHRYVLPRELI